MPAPHRPSPDAIARMRYDAAARSPVIAYLVWFFLGYGGVHRMYLGRWVSGLLMLMLLGVSTLLSVIFIGYVGLGLILLWWAIDALLIPGMARSYNNRVIDRLLG